LTSHESGTSGFIGRRQELAVLIAALDDALAGRGRLVMLAGEAGIGKTRIVQELASHAESLEVQVLWGWCYEREGAPPYWPWVQPIRHYINVVDPQQSRSEMGPGAADIAEVVPEVRQTLPDLDPAPALEPDQARFRFFDSIATFFKNAAQAQPLMLVLDDLHWADRPSMLLLEYMASQIGDSRVMMVGTYRDIEITGHHPLSETLAQLSREPVCRREHLGGLDLEETGRFIESSTGRVPSTNLVEAVHSHTEGNPFFTAEVIRLLSDQGELEVAQKGGIGSIRIPEGVREVIGQRLNRLSDSCNQVLTMASVIGREFKFGLLKILDSDASEEALLEMVDEAVAARLIEESPGGIDQYRFSHALIQQTLSEQLTTSRRVRLHARLAHALDELYGDNPRDHVAELAYHFAEALPVTGPEKSVHYSLLAGERALATYAYEEALAHFQQALNLKEYQPVDSETATLLFGLGRAQAATHTHQLEEAVSNLRRAFDYHAENGEVGQAVAIAEYPIPTLAGHHSGTPQLILDALALVQPDSHEAGRLLSQYGIAVGQEEGNYRGAQTAFAQALKVAQKMGDAALEKRTLAYAAQADFFLLRQTECIDKAVRALEIGHHSGDLRSEVIAHYSAMNALHPLGDLEGARRHAKAMLPIAERLGERFWLASALTRCEIVARLEGDWRTARNFSDRGLAVSSRDPRILSSRVLLEYQVGNYDQAEICLKPLIEELGKSTPEPSALYAYTAITLQVVARMTGRTDHLDIAKTASETVLSSPSVNPLFATRANAGLALTAVMQGDAATATKLYAALKPVEGTMLSNGFLAVDRLLGLLSQTMGNLEQSAGHFENALTFCRKAGYKPELAWTCCDYADTLLDRNGAGDRAQAMSLLDESLAISADLGMRPLAERVAARQERAEAQPVRAPAYPDALTQREAEVIRLVAAGKTDREIAEELIISVNTVGNHVRSILSKTNSANRTEAARYAARRGLGPDEDLDGE